MRCNVTIEIPKGGGLRRQVESQGSVVILPFPDASVVQALEFVAYGFVNNSLNPADMLPADVFVLSNDILCVGDVVTVVVVGVRLRNDGDHKFLAVHASPRSVRTINDA